MGYSLPERMGLYFLIVEVNLWCPSCLMLIISLWEKICFLINHLVVIKALVMRPLVTFENAC